MNDGSMTWRVGALGEFWTSEELRKLGRRWTVLNNLNLPTADGGTREVDHVAVGPSGALVIQTKCWPSKVQQISESSLDVIAAAAAARRQAALVRLALRGVVPGEVVTATAMFWGSDLDSADELLLTNRDGVYIVHGRDADQWRAAVSTQRLLNCNDIEAVVGHLTPYLVAKQHIRDTKPPPGWKRPGPR